MFSLFESMSLIFVFLSINNMCSIIMVTLVLFHCNNRILIFDDRWSLVSNRFKTKYEFLSRHHTFHIWRLNRKYSDGITSRSVDRYQQEIMVRIYICWFLNRRIYVSLFFIQSFHHRYWNLLCFIDVLYIASVIR
jgi:hypothetical protein